MKNMFNNNNYNKISNYDDDDDNDVLVSSTAQVFAWTRTSAGYKRESRTALALWVSEYVASVSIYYYSYIYLVIYLFF